MFLNAYKIFVKATTIIILLISLWYVLTKTFDKDSIGSLSDWISCLSTFFTLVVAFKAYKAAPNWINQKLDENALTQATEIFSRDLIRYRKIIDIPYNQISNFVILKDLTDADGDGEVEAYFNEFVQSFKQLETEVGEIIKLRTEIEVNFMALHKMGWVLEEVAFDKYKKLDASVGKIHSIFMKTIALIKGYDNLDSGYSDKAMVFKDKIFVTCDSCYQIFEDFSENFELFFHHSNHIPLYFEGKK